MVRDNVQPIESALPALARASGAGGYAPFTYALENENSNKPFLTLATKTKETAMAISTEVYTYAWLQNHTSDELVELWRELDAPTLEEMNGEYEGTMIFPKSVEHARIRKTEGPGEWFGKAFAPEPTGEYPGQGYNLWFMPNGLVRTMRFAGEVNASLIDGRPSLMGYYKAFVSHNKDNGMTNEVRKLCDGLFVGIISTAVDHAYWGPVEAHSGRGHPHAFLLRGPIAPWRGVDDLKVDTANAG
ncbi:MAG: hypothetical protein ACI915_000588 [Gammaproteobacteria bacterium]|jgi:hypothetical protein